MEKEIITPVKGEEDDEREPYYGSTVIVWIRPKPGKFCKLSITVGDAKKSIIVLRSFFQNLKSEISMITEKIQNVDGKTEPGEG